MLSCMTSKDQLLYLGLLQQQIDALRAQIWQKELKEEKNKRSIGTNTSFRIEEKRDVILAIDQIIHHPDESFYIK